MNEDVNGCATIVGTSKTRKGVKNIRGRSFIDLTGQIFGRWKVIEIAEDRVYKNGKKRKQWLCECQCETKTIKLVPSEYLRNGRSQSCGCLKKETPFKVLKKYNTYDLSGEYGIGYTAKGEEFYFDLDDYEKIKDYSWYIDVNGYVASGTSSNTFRMHRYLFGLTSKKEIDHINHLKFDNRKQNLRECTRIENSHNKRKLKSNKSGVSGVHWNNHLHKWTVQMQLDNKMIYNGNFTNKDEAIKTRKELEEKYYKDFRYKEEEDAGLCNVSSNK